MSLTQIITDLAGMSLTVDGTPVTAYDLDATPGRVPEPPVRLFSLLQMDNTNIKPIVVDYSQIQARWLVKDFMLWSAVPSGQLLSEQLPKLTAYIDSYTTAIKTFQFTNHTQVALESIRFMPGAYQYPLGSERVYYAVETLLDITEIL